MFPTTLAGAAGHDAKQLERSENASSAHKKTERTQDESRRVSRASGSW